MPQIRSKNTIRRAATLLEVLVVVGIMSILAMSATPTITSVREVSQAGAVAELRRLAEFARAHAMASGTPTGIFTDVGNDVIGLRVLEDGSVGALADGLGGTIEDRSVAELFAGADLEVVSLADGESLWFDYDGTPHRRGADGARVGVLELTAIYTFGDGGTVKVHPVGGMIE